jgi:rubrerythrin
VTFAIALEESAVAAYYDAHQKLKDPKLLQAGASIMANEGQHLVVLRSVAKKNPVPNAFETGKAG